MVQAGKLPLVGGGTGVWSFCHIDDAASRHRRSPSTRGAPGVYNIVDDDPAPVSEWLPELARVVGAKPPRARAGVGRTAAHRRARRVADDQDPRVVEREGQARARVGAAVPELAGGVPHRPRLIQRAPCAAENATHSQHGVARGIRAYAGRDMAHSHDHAHAHGATNRTRLWVAIAIIGAFLVVQVVGGILSGSLALLADAGHMASDLIGLVVALVAAMVAARPATDRQTYGYRRAEVLGALVNGVILLVVAVSVAVAAVGRLITGAEGEAHEVQGVPMLVVAVLGLLANVAAALVLRGGAKDSINLRGAYLEVLGDLIGSALVIVAALVIVTTGFDAADPIASIAIAVLIVPRAVTLLRDVMHVLFESAPADTDVAEIREHLLGTAGRRRGARRARVADHLGFAGVQRPRRGRAVVFESGGTGDLLDELGGCLADHFDVAHSTFQLEPAGRAEQEQPQHP